MARIDFAKAREICTAAELRLAESSRREALARATPTDLERKVVRARKLRDKWRDLYERQARTDRRERAGRGAGTRSRSLEKSKLFAEVLARFETRRAKGAGETATFAAAPAKPSPAKSHRQSRAASRRGLRKKLKKRRAKRDERPPEASTAKTARKKPSNASPSKPPTRSKRAQVPDRSEQQAARAARKRARMQMTGLDSRIRGHVSARTRRFQGRRDHRQ